MIEDIADSMGLTSLNEITEREARQVLKEKLEQQESQQETSPEDSTPPSSSETGTMSSETSREYAPGIMMLMSEERRGSSSTETSEDSCRQTTDSLSSRTSPHINAILEKHLRGKRRTSIDAMSQSSSCQSYMTLPELHIYEEVYGDGRPFNPSFIESESDQVSSSHHSSSRRLRSSSVETSTARQRSNIYSLMKDSVDRRDVFL